ncbi:hypothetical protein CRUP_006431, partial [Coryphaenoides rupestris]
SLCAGITLIMITAMMITESQIKRIFGTMVGQKLQEFVEEVKPVGAVLTQATLELYHAVVFQGLLRAHRDFHDTKQSPGNQSQSVQEPMGRSRRAERLHLRVASPAPNARPARDEPEAVQDCILQLLCGYALTGHGTHSTVFSDRLVDHSDVDAFDPLSFPGPSWGPFRITRVVRVISQPRGNMLLVGVGGSGRQSLSKMAAFVCQYRVFQVEVTRQYRKPTKAAILERLWRPEPPTPTSSMLPRGWLMTRTTRLMVPGPLCAGLSQNKRAKLSGPHKSGRD